MIYILKKAWALVLVFISLLLVACAPELPSTETTYPAEEVVIPPLGDGARDIVSIKDIVYVRPDYIAIINEAKAISHELDNSALSYDEVCERIVALDEKYHSFSTMLTYMMIKNSVNSSDKNAASEYEYLKAAAPALTRAFEELCVSAAKSDYAERLEKELFWEGFTEEYADGTIYNDIVVSLLESEAEIESRYASLSTSTVKITYGDMTDTYDNIVSNLKSRYNENSPIFKKALYDCDTLFNKAVQKESASAFIELLKIRRRLADTLGYDSYAEYAYDILGHGYSEEELSTLLSDISEFAVPVYAALSSKAFAGYFKTHTPPSPDKGRIINRIYSALLSIDENIAEAYAYMLNSELYDIEKPDNNRLSGAFTTYLYEIDSPFVFATLSGDVSDYMTVAHEFGHFYDAYVNFNSDASLDLLEVSSTGLELLVLEALSESLTDSEYKYLYYFEMQSMLSALIFQGFYAKFEELAYAMPYDAINEEGLTRLLIESAEFMHLSTEYFSELSNVIIYHLVMEPFYVQSYCTSVISSLDMFFIESENDGAGRDAYISLINRNGGTDFTEELTRVSLPSPFRRGGVRKIANAIYYSIIGSYYFVEGSNNNSAA